MAWIEKTQKEISNIVKVGDKNWKEVCLENYLFFCWNHQITGWDFFTWLEVGAMAERCIVIVKQFGPQDTGCHLMMSLKFMKLHCQIRCILNQDSCLKAPHKKRLEYIDFDLISWAAKNLWRDIFFRWTNSKLKGVFPEVKNEKIPLWCLAHWTYPTYSEKGVCQFCLVVGQPDVCTSLSNSCWAPKLQIHELNLKWFVVSLLLLPLKR